VDAAGVGAEKGGDDADRGGLAGAVRAQQAEDLALADGERDAVDGDGVPVALDEVRDL
jgi:hypothetical protein